VIVETLSAFLILDEFLLLVWTHLLWDSVRY
jgi:hypothetical protein